MIKGISLRVTDRVHFRSGLLNDYTINYVFLKMMYFGGVTCLKEPVCKKLKRLLTMCRVQSLQTQSFWLRSLAIHLKFVNTVIRLKDEQ